jgi:hypothetical protein
MERDRGRVPRVAPEPDPDACRSGDDEQRPQPAQTHLPPADATPLDALEDRVEELVSK